VVRLCTSSRTTYGGSGGQDNETAAAEAPPGDRGGAHPAPLARARARRARAPGPLARRPCSGDRPRRAGGAWLVPEVDAQAAIEREQALAQRVADLEEQLEDFAIAVLLEERLARTSGERVSLDELAAEIGLGDFLAKERARRAAA